MKRWLAAACAATLLTGSLTACSSTGTTPNTNGGTNGTKGTPSGTSYTAPSGMTYPRGAAEDRSGYNRMTSSRSRYDGTSDGRYTAYSDGTVSPGSKVHRNGNTNSRTGGSGLMDATRDLVDGAGNAVRDAARGVGNAVRDMGSGMNNTLR